MIAFTIPHTGDKFQMPESLAECNRAQTRDLCELFWLYNSGTLTYEELLEAMVYKLLDIKFDAQLDEEQALDMHSNIKLLSERLTGFFDLNEDGKAVIRNNFIDNPFLWLRPGLVTYYGPQQELEDITYGQYLDALEAFINFSQTGELIYIDMLIGILFQPRFTLSRKLKPYNKSNNKNRARKFRHLDMGYRYGFYLYFASFQVYLTSARIFVHGNELDLSILFNPLPGAPVDDSKIPGIGMQGVAHSMAESGIYGNMDTLRDKPFWDILPLMHDVRKGHIDEYNQSKKKS